MKQWLVVLAITAMCVGVPSQSAAEVSVRGGLSSMTGLVGVEYRMGNISLGAGPLNGPIALSARYTLNTEGNSVWAGLAFVLNKQEVIDEIDEDFNIKTKDIPLLGPVVGYRLGLNESLDLSIGGGYGVYLGADDNAGEETADILLDFSLGYSF